MNKEAAAFLTKTRYDFAALCTIMKLLRAPGGCPWDREQTHRSIRKNLIEETYEVVEAIDNDDSVLLREELGDLMLQVVFHARMAEEEGAFDIGDVCDEICRKLIRIFSRTSPPPPPARCWTIGIRSSARPKSRRARPSRCRASPGHSPR